LSGGGEGGRNDATGLTNGEKAVPSVGSDDAAAVGGKQLGLEVERAEKVACWVRKWKGARPSNEFGWVGSLGGGDKLNGAELHDSVDGVDREAVPLGPPTAPRVTQSFVGWMLEEKLNVVDTGSIGVDTIGVGGC
jgi:hypothetical protein